MVVFQSPDREGLRIAAGLFVCREHYPQPFPEIDLDRIAQEAGQPLQIERGRRVGRKGRGRGPFDLRYVRRMCTTPLAGIGQQVRARLEIGPAEGLQRVLGGPLGDCLPAPDRGEVVAQLGDEHRGWEFAVVAYAASGPAHVEEAPGRQQRLQHQLSVVLLAGAVAWAALPGPSHEVEVAAVGASGVVAIVHPHQADGLERDRAHRHQGAEGDTPRPETPVEGGGLQHLQPGLTEGGQGQRFVEAGLVAGRAQTGQGLPQCRHRLAVRLVGGPEHGREQVACQLDPSGRDMWSSTLLRPVPQGLQQVRQAARQFCLQPANLIVWLIIGLDPVAGRVQLTQVRQAAGGVSQ